MLYFLKDKKDCTGCTACVNICPVKCITMKEDEEGFSYPFADDRCIGCRQCEYVCPIYSEKTFLEPGIPQIAAAAVSEDKEIWKESASGGAFSEICRAFGDSETIVFGAAFDGLRVVHKYIVGVENIAPFRKSKYVQSDPDDSLGVARDFLEQGRKVIFSGLPCQIAGLRSLLGKDYENLLCIDLICHGVGSPKVFADSIKFTQERLGSQVRSYSFRVKRSKMGNLKLYVSRYKLEDGRILFIEKDDYNKLFLDQLCLRRSCAENCRFRNAGRFGDLTLGDFKNRERVFPRLMDYRNYSTVVVNTKKGERVFHIVSKSMKVLQCSIEQVKRYNPLFYRQTETNNLRDNFFRDYLSGNTLDQLVLRYTNKKSRGMRFLKDLIPYRTKFLLKRLFSKLRELHKKSEVGV